MTIARKNRYVAGVNFKLTYYGVPRIGSMAETTIGR